MKRTMHAFGFGSAAALALLLAFPCMAQETARRTSEESVVLAEGEKAGDIEITSPNGSITLEKGSSAGSLSTKAGIISLRENNEAGALRSVDGPIVVGPKSTAGDVTSMNGAVTLMEGASVRGIRTVSAHIKLEKDAKVEQLVSTDHGNITVGEGASIGEGMRTSGGLIEVRGGTLKGNVVITDGGLLLTDGATLEGDLTLLESKTKKPKLLTTKKERAALGVVVVIGPKSEVKGTMNFKDNVELFVHESAKVSTVNGTTAIPYNEDTPPKMPTPSSKGLK